MPDIVILELAALRVPLLIKSPLKVRPLLLPALRVAPELILRGTLVLLPNCLEPFRVITPVLLIRTPPAATNGVIHSLPTVLAVAVLYCKVAAGP